MVVMRPVTAEDLSAVEALAQLTGFGLTTLPRDARLLRRRIRDSLRGFEKMDDEDPPRGETYLFVMQDTETGKVVGTSAVVSKIGGFEPFYAFRLETSIHESKQLSVRKELRTLHLVEQHDGPCEIGTLFLSPDYRREGNGRLLSLSRFLFMADHIEYFDPTVIAEMRGVVDNKGRCPFWDAIGHHFFDIDFPTADYLCMVSKQFIADLMPKHPIYIPLLPPEAQAVIGHVHPETEPALKLLSDEGFKPSGMIDLFEGGPVVQCPLKDIRSIKQSMKLPVREIVPQAPKSAPMIISNTRRDYRACKGTVEVSNDGAKIDTAVAAALQVKIGDPVRFVTSKA